MKLLIQLILYQFLEFDQPNTGGETNDIPTYNGQRESEAEGGHHKEQIHFSIQSRVNPSQSSRDVTWTNGSSRGYEIAIVDFARVRIPFLIAAWILFASLAKIGNLIVIL